jgi:hypothetical protein
MGAAGVLLAKQRINDMIVKVMFSTQGTMRVFRQTFTLSRMPLSFTPLLRLKLLQACDQWHSSRASTFLPVHANTEGTKKDMSIRPPNHELCHHADDVTQH